MTTRSNNAGSTNKENAARRLKENQEAERLLEAAAAESYKTREEESKPRTDDNYKQAAQGN